MLAAKFQLVLLLDLGYEVCKSISHEFLQVAHAETRACVAFPSISNQGSLWIDCLLELSPHTDQRAAISPPGKEGTA